MQYTGSVNKVIWFFFIPFLLSLYLVFRLWDYTNFNGVDIQDVLSSHSNNTSDYSNLDALILGGSNSLFSLSAKQMTNDTDNNWYNLSLLGEGYSDKNYWNFIDNTLVSQSKELIEKVVYSSISPLRESFIIDRKTIGHGIYGDDSFSIIGNRSAASYAKQFLKEGKITNKAISQVNSYGDIIFDDNACVKGDRTFPFYRNIDEDQVENWLFDQLDMISMIFTKSQIYFVIPSEYYKKFDIDTSAAFKNLIRSKINFYNKVNNKKVILVFQPNFETLDMICNGQHHGNTSGRKWRTENLINYIK